MAIEIVDLATENGDLAHSYVNVYQAGYGTRVPESLIFLGLLTNHNS